MLRIGLTGSIGMGKTTTAGLFAEAGVPVNDSDAAVHDLYSNEALLPVDQAFPGTAKNGPIDRQELTRRLAASPDAFKRLEAIVHPLVRKREADFIDRQRAAGTEMVLLDIPLLFETASEKRADVIVVVSCDPQIQRQRVLARPNMTEEKFNMILSRQMPDDEKRARADYVIDTGHGVEIAKARVEEIIADLRKRIAKGDFPNA